MNKVAVITGASRGIWNLIIFLRQLLMYKKYLTPHDPHHFCLLRLILAWISGLFTLVFSLFAWFFLIFVKGGNWMLNLMMLFMGRKQEYRADQFAIKVGFGAGLLSLLDKIKNMQFDSPKNLFERLYATHPPTMLRIGEVEKVISEI